MQKIFMLLKYGLGLFCSRKQTFSHTIRKLSPSVTSLLNIIAKNDIKALSCHEANSWEKQITCADGASLTKIVQMAVQETEITRTIPYCIKHTSVKMGFLMTSQKIL